ADVTGAARRRRRRRGSGAGGGGGGAGRGGGAPAGRGRRGAAPRRAVVAATRRQHGRCDGQGGATDADSVKHLPPGESPVVRPFRFVVGHGHGPPASPSPGPWRVVPIGRQLWTSRGDRKESHVRRRRRGGAPPSAQLSPLDG